MKEDRFRFNICHVEKSGDRIIAGKTLNPAIPSYPGYPTEEVLRTKVIPALIAMENRGRKDVRFPLGVYSYAFRNPKSPDREKLFVQEVPEKSYGALEPKRGKVMPFEISPWKRVLYYIDEKHELHQVLNDRIVPV